LADFKQNPVHACSVVGACAGPEPVWPANYPATNITDRSGEKAFKAWKRDTGIGRFLLVSDFHLDLDYEVGSEADCGLPVCCKRSQKDSDVIRQPASKYGSMGCDCPIRALHELMELVTSMQDDIDFVIYTGDSPGHDVWEQSSRENLAVADTVLKVLQERFGDSMPVFIALGNHAMFPVNLFLGPQADRCVCVWTCVSV
jgi:sphingomyelin phosphodiesterase